jgi:hypothetical protein
VREAPERDDTVDVTEEHRFAAHLLGL